MLFWFGLAQSIFLLPFIDSNHTVLIYILIKKRKPLPFFLGCCSFFGPHYLIPVSLDGLAHNVYLIHA